MAEVALHKTLEEFYQRIIAILVQARKQTVTAYFDQCRPLSIIAEGIHEEWCRCPLLYLVVRFDLDPFLSRVSSS